MDKAKSELADTDYRQHLIDNAFPPF